MVLQYNTERSVLLKILLHAAGHPSQSVNGVLLGKIVEQGSAEGPGSPRGPEQQATVHIVDALPLFHSFLALAPMTEVGLIQADELARSQDLQLVGYYHANERIDDLELGPAGKRIADRIHSHNQQSCVLLVDNSRLGSFLQQKDPHFLQLYVKEAQKGGAAWTQVPISNLQSDAATVPQLFLDYHAEGRHQELIDFDDHLNNIKKDWTNATLLT